MANQPPQTEAISLPKGGGAITGIGETFNDVIVLSEIRQDRVVDDAHGLVPGDLD